jgi:hypothetical protein
VAKAVVAKAVVAKAVVAKAYKDWDQYRTCYVFVFPN